MAQPKDSHTTTLTAPLTMWAELDELRAKRAKESGRRPLTRELLIEAVAQFIAREKKKCERVNR